MYGRWDLVGRESKPDVGALVFKAEYRHSIGAEPPPNGILSAAGVAGISGPTFSAAGGVLTHLFWTQAFADNHFAEGEYLKHLEFGLEGSWATRTTHNAHVLLWQVDDREEAGIEGGWGATLSWSTDLVSGLVPFPRGGYSDSGGTLVDRMIGIGFGYAIGDRDDFFGFGANWGRAPDVTRTQYQLESHYRTSIMRGLLVVPSVQHLLNPAYEPE